MEGREDQERGAAMARGFRHDQGDHLQPIGIKGSGSGFYHFPIGTPDDYFIQLTAEKQTTKYHNGYPKIEWVMTGPHNEALDCEVYAYVAAIRAGLARVDWSVYDETVQTQQRRKKKKPKVAKSKFMGG